MQQSTTRRLHSAHLAQQKPLAAPYAGSYLVVSKGAKMFTIQVG
jgi:hypothetical protein